MLSVGVDGCPVGPRSAGGGWVGVALRDGAFHAAATAARLADLLAALPGAAAVGVDIPIGLVERGWRRADLEARRALGRQGASVFLTPPRAAVEAAGYEQARRRCRELTGQGLGIQAWRLVPRIRDAEACRTADGAALFEVHPELSFRELAGGPLAGKRTWEGQAARRALLERAGIALPGDLGPAGRVARADDVLDAAAAAWSAARIAAGTATSLPDPPEPAPDGHPIAIWY